MGRLVVAGALATVAFDLFGQTVSPPPGGIVPTFGAKPAPAAMADSVTGRTTVGRPGVGHGLHVRTGVLAYPFGWAMAAPPWWPAAIGYGVGLRVFALHVMAHLAAGDPPLLGDGGLTRVAPWGHILFALLVATVSPGPIPPGAPPTARRRRPSWTGSRPGRRRWRRCWRANPS